MNCRSEHSLRQPGASTLALHLSPQMNSRLFRSLSFLCFVLGLSFAAFAESQRISVLDPLAVQSQGDSSRAVMAVTLPRRIPEQRCDVVIIGAGLGGSAAALMSSSQGLHVCMTDPTFWIGGQMTSQGVSASDDNELTETTGSSRSFQHLRHIIRQHYSPMLRDGVKADASLNPGLCWVSYECAEATVAHDALRGILAPYVANGTLTLLLRTAPVFVERKRDLLTSVVVYDFRSRRLLRLRGTIFIDSSELGEFLPMAGAEYVTGAESQKETGEPDAPLQANPDAVQSFTYPFVLERGRPVGKSARPIGYEEYRLHFSLNASDAEGHVIRYGVFQRFPGAAGSFWTYRRLLAKEQFLPGSFPSDLSMINWDSNDVCDKDLLSLDPLKQAKAMQHGKQVSLAFAWWLQHEVLRDDGEGEGYSELRLVRKAMNSRDGLSQFPYIRESRRIRAVSTVHEQDLVTSEARARRFDDTVGIGQYPIDIHACGQRFPLPKSKPYQIPLGAMLSVDINNLLAASKNIGTTHITNGAYRLHPTEWAIGSAAGAAAAFSVRTHVGLKQIDSDPLILRKLQQELLASGQPLVWFDDLPLDSPYFRNVQMAAVLGIVQLQKDSLSFHPEAPMSGQEVAFSLRQIGEGTATLATEDRVNWSTLGRWGYGAEARSGEVKRGDFANWLMTLYRERKQF